MTVIWGTTPYGGYMGSPLYDGLSELNPSYKGSKRALSCVRVRMGTVELTGGAADRAAPRFRWHSWVHRVAGGVLQLLPIWQRLLGRSGACWPGVKDLGQARGARSRAEPR